MSALASPFGSDHAAWLVDLDGTLYRAGPVKLAMACELALAGWSAIGTLRRFRAEHEGVRASAIAGDPWNEQLERTARATGTTPAEVEAIVRAWMIERPSKWLRRFRRRELLEALAEFREKGGRTALVSDYPARDKLGSLRAEHLFDVVVASGEPGGPQRLKPDPDGMLRAARALGVEPSACLVIGDRQDADGAAARAAGMAYRSV